MADNDRRTRAARLAAAVLAAAAFAGGRAAAGPDPLDRARAARQVADQKADAQVREAVREADKLAAASPTAAVRQLNQLGLSLDLSADISSEKRQELVTLLRGRVAAIEGKGTPAPDPKARQAKDDRRKAFEAGQAEAKEVKAGVAEVGKLAAADKPREARAKIGDLARKYPDNPSVVSLAGRGLLADRVAEARQLAREQNDRFAYVMNDAARSALPPKGDVEFPANWKEITERRNRAEFKLGPDEEAILKALDRVVKSAVKDAPFEETLQSLSDLIDKPIYLDKKSLEDAGLDLRRPVSAPGGVTARTALRAVLQSQGLTFIVRDRVIQVVTLEKAKESLVTRAYYLGDLVAATGPYGGAVTWGPVADAQQTAANARVIMDAITSSIDPLTWRAKGGPSTVTFHYPSLSVIVRAPAEVHATLGGRLGGR